MAGGYWNDVAEAPDSKRSASDRVGYGEWVSGVEWDFRVLDLAAQIELPGLTRTQQSFAGHGVVTLKPDRNAELLAALEETFPAPSDLPDGRRHPTLEGDALQAAAAAGYDGGQGYGTGDQREVERAAVNEVKRLLRAEGWDVVSVEFEKCGWDLTATKDDEIRRVEVKGTKGKRPDVLVTRNELDKAREHGLLWEFWAVTQALRDADRQTHRFPSAEVVTAAKPVVYRANLS
jgi:hypothetical protein